MGAARPGDPPRLPARARRRPARCSSAGSSAACATGPARPGCSNRLKAIGLRPISALVDITNYLTFDLCRPLHVFDAAKLEGDLVLRFARPGEELQALDGRTYRLDDGMTVIADAAGPVSLGGIMGGEATGVTEATTEVVLEVALFDPLRTAATGRRLGIESDARTRFERGLDPALVLPATEFATRLILELCGGEAGPAVVAGAVPGTGAGRPLPATRACGGWPASTCEPPEIERLLAGARLRRSSGGPEEWRVAAAVLAPRRDAPRPASSRSWRGCTATTGSRRCRCTRGAAVGAGVLTPVQRRRAAVRRAVAELGLCRGGDLVVHPAASTPRRSARRADPQAQSAQRRAVGDAALAAAEPGRGRGTQPRPQAGATAALFELGPRFTGDQPGEQVVALAGAALRRRRRRGTGPRRRGRSMRSTPRATR